MGKGRKFILPSTFDERRDLVNGITLMCFRVLGYPTRQANIARWTQMEMPELRRVHENWCKFMRSHEAAGEKLTQVRLGIQEGVL